MEEKNYPVHEPCPCFDKDGNQLGWFNPRHTATALFVFAWSECFKEWCVLAGERGAGAGTHQGMLNSACGYMSTNVTLKENAVKELEEEFGVVVSPESLIPCGIEDDPSAYGQHITHRFATILDCDILDVELSHAKNEVDEHGNLEVGKIAFVPLSHVGDGGKEWAFNHDKRIKEISKQIKWELKKARLRKKLAKLLNRVRK